MSGLEIEKQSLEAALTDNIQLVPRTSDGHLILRSADGDGVPDIDLTALGLSTAGVYGTERVSANEPGPIIQDADAFEYLTALTLVTGALDAGRTYQLKWSFLWSYNATNSDFLGRIEQNGSPIWDMRQEPQDSGGPGPGGTDQRHPAMQFLEITGDSGVQTFDFRIASSADNVDTLAQDIWMEFFRVE